MIKTKPAYSPIDLVATADARQGSADGNPVINIRAVIETGLRTEQVALADGSTQYVRVPTQDYFDVAVWDTDLLGEAAAIKKGQTFSVSPRSIKAAKPYQDKTTGEYRSGVNLVAAELIAGPMAGRKATAAAPALAGSEVPF